MNSCHDQRRSGATAAQSIETLSSVELTLVTPMFNEESHIAQNMQALTSALRDIGVPWEYIVVDDGSTDRSLEVAARVAATEPRCSIIHYRRNRGRGYALRRGFEAARGTYVVATESDLSWGPGIVDRLYQELRASGSDIVIASVYLPEGGFENVPAFRRYLSSVGNAILRWSFGGGLTMFSGMTRGYRREALRRLPLYDDSKEIHLEIVSKAQTLGLQMTEIPAIIRWAPPKPGERQRSRLGIVRFVVPHLLVSFNQGAVKSFFAASALVGAVGAIAIAVSTLNKLFRILPVLLPNLATYGLVLCVLAGLIGLFALVSIQLRFLHQSVVHMQSRLLELSKDERPQPRGCPGDTPDPG